MPGVSSRTLRSIVVFGLLAFLCETLQAGQNPQSKVPANAYAVGDRWVCNNGFRRVACTAPGSLDTGERYAAWRSSCASRASIGV